MRTDRLHKARGGLITLIRDNITFTTTDIPSTINTHNIELQMVKVHINNTKHITIANIYIPPRDTTSTHYKTADTDIQHCIQYITNIPHSVLTGDVNAHSTLWHSYTDDHRGQLIADVISNSDHIKLNTNTPTRVPNTTLQQTSSPDITTVSNTLYNRTSWTTQHALSSDHLPIITTINIRHDYRLQQNRLTFTNYKKADWTQFTEDTESAFAQTTIPTNIHTANRMFTNFILMAEKQNIPKGNMHSNCRLLPEDIVCKITQRNNIRRANTCDPALKLLNEEITSDIQKHKQNIWKEHLDAHWDHRHNTHTLWKTIHGLSNRAPPHTLNTSITFNNKIATTPTHIANCFTKQFTNTVKHTTHKTNRHINRATHNIQGYNITLTTSQVQEAIKQSKNTNSQGPDKLNIRHLKHIGPLGLAFLTSMFKTALNKNIIPHTWKLANIVPIPKPNKDTHKGTSYRPISLLSVIAKTLEKSLLPYITANTPMQHIYTSDLSPPSAPVQVMAYADDITITSTHTSTSAAKNNHTYTKFLPGQNKTTSY